MPLELYIDLAGVEGLRDELGRIKGIGPWSGKYWGFPEHGNIPIQPDMWGREVIFKEKGTDNYNGFPRP